MPLDADIFYHPASLLHNTGHHPENAGRLRAILAALERSGRPERTLIRPEPVDLDLLAQVHDARYISIIEQAARAGGGYWDLDTVISPDSYDAALVGAGGAVAAVDSAMNGGRAPFAMMRPPGHHALHAAAMGFCIFNNVAVAAQHAVANHGLERVLIVDWDIHHGNGTQDAFYTRSDVLFFSTHRYPFYPGTGALHETGAGQGTGYNVNVPLPARVGDAGYREIFEQVLEPLVARYRPELILISAGYDAHVMDPLGDASLTTEGFAQLTRVLRDLADGTPECNGRLAAILEGGYNAEALAEGVLVTLENMAGPAAPGSAVAQENSTVRPTYGRRPDISGLIRQVRQAHRL